MVECARLEIVYTGNRIKGSNPFVSARNNKMPRGGILLFPVKRNGANTSQSQIAGSTTSRFAKRQCGQIVTVAPQPAHLCRARKSLRLRHNKKHARIGVIFFIVFDNMDSNPGARVRTAAKIKRKNYHKKHWIFYIML